MHKQLPQIGDKAEVKKVYTSEIVELFADLSGDHNPLHLDEKFAQNTVFKRKIVHGFLVAAQISQLIATELPGPGSIYINQTLNFKRPVFHNQTITCTAEVTNVKPEKSIIELLTICYNEEMQIVIDGTAVIKLT